MLTNDGQAFSFFCNHTDRWTRITISIMIMIRIITINDKIRANVREKRWKARLTPGFLTSSSF